MKPIEQAREIEKEIKRNLNNIRVAGETPFETKELINLKQKLSSLKIEGCGRGHTRVEDSLIGCGRKYDGKIILCESCQKEQKELDEIKSRCL